MASPVPRDHGEAVPEKKNWSGRPVARLAWSPGCRVGRAARLPGWPPPGCARLPSTTQIDFYNKKLAF